MTNDGILPLPYGGWPVSIPGKIEAEEFDTGGAALAYSDTNTANMGGVSDARLNVLSMR